MAVVKGTNCGFVTVAPVEDPHGTGGVIDNAARSIKDVAPAGAIKITEIGWWCNNPGEESSFEVGLYSHNAGSDEPQTRLYVDNTNAQGLTTGWKTVAVDWEITAGTTYWIAVQVDNTSVNTTVDYTNSNDERQATESPASTLSATWTLGAILDDPVAIYAVYEGAGGGGTGIMTLNTGYWGGV
jgi:hypothetical protein